MAVSCRRASSYAFASIALALALWSPVLLGADLSAIQQRIATVESAIIEKRVEYEVARERVVEIEQLLHTARQDAAVLDETLAKKSARITDLQARRQALVHAVDASSDQTAALLRSHFKRSQYWRLKALLGATDLSALQRHLKYLDYITGANNAALDARNAQLRELGQLEAALKLEADSLRRLKSQAAGRVEALSANFAARDRIAASLESLLDEHSAELKQLRIDETHLTKLVDEMLEDDHPSDPQRTAFSALKGKMRWPTAGRVAKSPGTEMRDGGARWSGVIIESSPGSDVAAIAQGLVVFADWFRNLGLLVIIEHGDGYMSLYGHNSELFVSGGELVEAGDVVAKVGDTGGRRSTGLYFEIRQNGDPEDPRLWCKRD